MPRVSYRIARPLALALAGACGLWSCAGRSAPPAASPERLVWPLPPDTARIEFVQVIQYPSDLRGRREGALQRLVTGGASPLFTRPFGVATAGADRLLVADPIAASLTLLDLATGAVTPLGISGRGRLERPCCVTTSSDGRIFVSDLDGARVVEFDSAGEFVSAFGGRDMFTRPAGLAVDSERRRLYVADIGRHRVTVHDLDTGGLLFDIGGRGAGDGLFNFPTDVAVDSSGRLYVLDAMNFRVQRFIPTGQFVDAFGSAGDAIGHFSRPKGLAVGSDGIIYVVDAAFGNFQLFDSSFAPLMAVGSYGHGFGQFDLPAGIAVSCRQRIFVADGLNGRVQVFRRLDVGERCP